MKKSSASQMTFNFQSTDANIRKQSVGIDDHRIHEINNMRHISREDTVVFPSFNDRLDVKAIALKFEGRRNAAQISEQEHQDLLLERKSLLDKKFQGQFSRKEEVRLEYVRWSLDRIEDAKSGFMLDSLDGAVSQYEDFLSSIKALQNMLADNLKNKR